jgi:uncharacterized RDD family membrane protein YckC
MPQGGPPPASYGGPPGATKPYSEWWKRVVAAIIDGLVIGIPSSILLSIFSIGTFSSAELTCDANGVCTTTGGTGFFMGFLISWLVITAVGIAYKIYFDGSEKGQTVGKMAMKIQVRDEATGGPIGYGRAAIRYVVAAALSAFTCGIGGLVDLLFPLWDPKRQTLHDKAANSVVVDLPQ